jgi:hypothetical protein
MLPLAKFWTFAGHWFVSLTVVWAYFVRTGSDEGVLVSRGYWGLLVSLLVGTAMMSALALYISAARRANAPIAIPPNTTFEDDANRQPLISWLTVLVLCAAIFVSLVVFGDRYSSSKIHAWDCKEPLADGFLTSRLKAHDPGAKGLLAMGNRFDERGKKLNEVNEYVRYWSDSVLLLLSYTFSVSLVCLLLVAAGIQERDRDQR